MTRQEMINKAEMYQMAFRETGNINFYLRAKKLQRLIQKDSLLLLNKKLEVTT